LANNLNTDDDNLIDESNGSLLTQIQILRKKVNSFTKWKIIITLYMIASGGLISFLIYALYNHLVK